MRKTQFAYHAAALVLGVGFSLVVFDHREPGKKNGSMVSGSSLLSPRASGQSRIHSFINAERSEAEKLESIAAWTAPETEADCWRWLEALDDPTGRDYTTLALLAPQVIQQLAVLAPAETFDRLWESSRLRRREAYLAELMHAWTKLNAPAALRQLNAIDDIGLLKTTLAGSVADALVSIDPERAVQLITDYQLTNEYEDRFFHATHQDRFRRAFSALARLDPDLASRQALRINGSWERVKALESVVRTWGEADPEGAVAFLEGDGVFQPNDDPGPVWRAAARGMAKRDPETAMDLLVEHAPEPVGREWVLRSVIEVWAETDLRAAHERAAQLGGFIDTIASAWAEKDPQGALDWASNLTGGERISALNSVSRTLAATDPAIAFQASIPISPKFSAVMNRIPVRSLMWIRAR